MQKLFLIVMALILAGCSGNPADRREQTEAEHYRDARKLLERRTFLNAIEQYEELEARFPYGDYAEQAQIDLIYARYRSLDYPGASAQAERFIRTYPNHEHLDYVLYLRGLAHYNMEQALFESVFGSEKSTRDLSHMRDAFRDFDELVRRFPDSDYAADARSRMLYIRSLLAEQELIAARYYARRKAYIAAANRAQYVIRHFQGTPSVPEALAILTRSYDSLGQPALAQNSQRLLAHNWPDSEWLEDGKVEISWWPSSERDWLRLLTFDLLK
ncbi:MAG: outer membrane protein assembly factor BamD [Alcanivoracaceae bacterium]